MTLKWTILSLGVACLAGIPLAEAGTSFARADANAAQSLASGMGTARPLLLQRLAGNADATLATLLPTVCKGACASATRETRDGVQHVSGDGWQLDVSADGTMAEFSDDRVRARAHDLGVDAAAAIPPATLEAAGRRFIATRLAGVVALRPGEQLVPEATYARNEGGIDSNGLRAAERTTAQRIVFTREIDGIPVVGNGSKIAITFSNDMTVESFRYDWPDYVIRGSAPAMVARDVLLQRVQSVVGTRTGQPSAKAIAVNAGAATADLGGGAELNRLECGYYDAGLPDRDASAPVQAGCVYHAVHSEAGAVVTRAGYAGAVPAAVQPEADARWPEEKLLRGQAVRAAGDPGAALAR